MSIKELLDREGDAAERNVDAPLKPGTRVTRGHGRTKTLQVRLTDTEYEELEREADAAGLPVSTLGRQRLLDSRQGSGRGGASGHTLEEIADAVYERFNREEDHFGGGGIAAFTTRANARYGLDPGALAFGVGNVDPRRSAT